MAATRSYYAVATKTALVQHQTWLTRDERASEGGRVVSRYPGYETILQLGVNGIDKPLLPIAVAVAAVVVLVAVVVGSSSSGSMYMQVVSMLVEMVSVAELPAAPRVCSEVVGFTGTRVAENHKQDTNHIMTLMARTVRCEVARRSMYSEVKQEDSGQTGDDSFVRSAVCLSAGLLYSVPTDVAAEITS